MLGKLAKYELKATARFFLPLYGALILMAAINRLAMEISARNIASVLMSILSSVTMTAYVILTVGVFALTFIVMLQRFYKNLVKDEGYLMFTLPVKVWQMVVSKLAVSLLWFIASAVSLLASILVMTYTHGALACIREFFAVVNGFIAQNIGPVGLIYAEAALLIILSGIMYVMMFYGAMSLGSLFKNKSLGAFGGFFILYFVQQLFNIIMVIAGIGLNFESSDIPFNIATAQYFIWGGAAYFLLFGVCYFILTNYILTKKLNLE
jgi:hypothetical protein